MRCTRLSPYRAKVPVPLLFLDVDGPLIPFGGTAYPSFGPPDDANPLLSRLDPAHGPRLAALSCELVWATSWLADANTCIAPRLGLPALPVVDWPDTDDLPGLHWKTRTLVTWAGDRPFAWVDDELTDTDRTWVSAHHPVPTLLHRVNPNHGLTAADYTLLDTWLRVHRAD